MQILSTRSKVSLRRFYESFTSNKRCKSYVHDNGTMKGAQVLQGEQAFIDEVKARILKFDGRRTIQDYYIKERMQY